MTLVKLWTLFIGINKSRHETATVSNHQLQSGRRGTLVVAGAIVGVPDQHGWNRGVHAGGHEEGHAVFDLGVCYADVGDDGVADDGGDEGEEHDDATKLHAI